MFKKWSHVFFSVLALCGFSAHAAVILQYHHVSESLPKVTSVEANTFRAHLTYLKQNEYNVIALDTLLEGLREHADFPDKTVAITFDDGYDNNIEEAAPILAEFGYPYTIFVNPALIDEQRGYVMTWEQLRTLDKQGALIANHSSRHEYLHHKLDGETQTQWRERIKQDIVSAEKRIEEEIGYSLKYLAYPYGEFNRALQDLVAELGYVGIGQHSGALGPHNDVTRLPRFPASGFYADLQTLSTKLESLPFDITSLDYSDTVTSQTQPKITIEFAHTPFNQGQFACYVSGQGQANLTWEGKNKVTVSAKQALNKGRSRYNCTAPDKRNPGRYLWFSQPWVITSSPD
ncbi:polysaccharide deacetylase family protein [Pseudoalteromonas sp. SSDWG2]|uniref:polysaccharide deacetylase family protein n=1 Tax=Pseudoalteromonas sp. SSDWG2 TaxID=3139391 RepID=UPI003BA96566